jgi:hypothetical protein
MGIFCKGKLAIHSKWIGVLKPVDNEELIKKIERLIDNNA